jgi:hypothetical protein
MARHSLAPSSPDDILAARRARIRAAAEIPPDQHAVQRMPKEQVGVLYDTDGHPTHTVRRINVFQQFARDKGGDAAERRRAQVLAAHGAALMVLYARAHGIAGGRDLSVRDYVDCDASHDWEEIALNRAIAQGNATDRLKQVLDSVGAMSKSVLVALCHDWFYGDGKPVPRANGRREAAWRGVVRAAYKANGRVLSTSNEESLAVWEALFNLSQAVW